MAGIFCLAITNYSGTWAGICIFFAHFLVFFEFLGVFGAEQHLCISVYSDLPTWGL